MYYDLSPMIKLFILLPLFLVLANAHAKVALIQRLLDHGQVEFLTCSLDPEVNHEVDGEVIAALEQTNNNGREDCVPTFGEGALFHLDDFRFRPNVRKVGAVVWGLTSLFAGGSIGYKIYIAYNTIRLYAGGVTLEILRWRQYQSVAAILGAGFVSGAILLIKKANPIYMWSKADVAQAIHANNFQYTGADEVAIIFDDRAEMRNFVLKVADLLDIEGTNSNLMESVYSYSYKFYLK